MDHNCVTHIHYSGDPKAVASRRLCLVTLSKFLGARVYSGIVLGGAVCLIMSLIAGGRYLMCLLPLVPCKTL